MATWAKGRSAMTSSLGPIIFPTVLGVGALVWAGFLKRLRQAVSAAIRWEDRYRVLGVYIYPVKSMAAVALQTAKFDTHGLAYDRRFAVTDLGGRLLSQRDKGRLAAIQPAISTDGFLELRDLCHPELDMVRVPLQATHDGEAVHTEVLPPSWLEWGDFKPLCSDCGREAAMWLTATLDWPSETDSPKYRLVRMAEDFQTSLPPSPTRSRSATSHEFATLFEEHDQLMFQDASPLTIGSTASLLDLNRRLAKAGKQPVTMHRFRPNIVVDTKRPFVEDWWSKLKLQGPDSRREIALRVAKPCHRCVMITKPQAEGEGRDQESWPSSPAAMRSEPLKTLKEFRMRLGGRDQKFGNAPCFCVNVAMSSPVDAYQAQVSVGDFLLVERWAKTSMLTAQDLQAALQ